MIGPNKKDLKKIEIPVGYAMIFRGDLPHAGSSYSKKHHRLYCKFVPSSLNIDDDSYEFGRIQRVVTCPICKYFIIGKTQTSHISQGEHYHSLREIKYKKIYKSSKCDEATKKMIEKSEFSVPLPKQK